MSQKASWQDSCLFSRIDTVNAFVKGFRQKMVSGENIEYISKQDILQGFELSLSDTSFKILRYMVSFVVEDTSVHLYTLPYFSKMAVLPERFADVKPTSSLFIDCIIIKKNNVAYSVPPKVYWISK